jgi:hypothetical protein
MNAISPVKMIAFAIFFCVFAPRVLGQTEQQLAEIKSISDQDWTTTLDFSGWLLDAQFWIDHPDSEYAKQFFAQLNLSAADDAAFRAIVADFNKRHDQLMADNYAKLDRNEWTPETETKLLKDLLDATNDALQRIKTNLTADGANKVATAFS